MGSNDDLNEVVDKAKGTVANVPEAAKEARHRSPAGAEQTKRDVARDHMTVGQNAGSMLNQAHNSPQARIDAAKRNVRNST